MIGREIRRLDWLDLLDYPYTGCDLCADRAECLLESQPLCLDCAEDAIDRASLPDSLRALAPALSDR